MLLPYGHVVLLPYGQVVLLPCPGRPSSGAFFGGFPTALSPGGGGGRGWGSASHRRTRRTPSMPITISPAVYAAITTVAATVQYTNGSSETTGPTMHQAVVP